MVPLLLLLAAATAAAALEGPCDILDAAGNPCVAAHSTVRALYSEYSGPLYNVTRSSDGTSKSISVLAAGGFANKPAHDAFCSKLDCVISNVFDQSPQHNHLGQRHRLINASRHSVTVGKDKTPVYGMWFDPGFGYHVDNTTGIATGNEEESIYAVMSGKNFNGGCCFDYGNSETNDRDDGAGAMEAIYFGNAHWHGNTGGGATGPWVGADLEAGMYYGGGSKTRVNNESQALPHDFVSLTLKGWSEGFTLKGGDATQGAQTVMYNGSRPFEPDSTPPTTHRRLASGSAAVRASGAPVSLQKCTAGNTKQQWGFEKNGLSIASDGSCLDIEHFKRTKGSGIWAYPCGGTNSKDNEFWAVQDGTIRALQHETPFCLGMKGGAATVGTEPVLDSCSAPSATFVIGFSNSSSSGNGTIVQKASGLCLTTSDFPTPGGRYQPMKKQGAIILATGGDNSNSAQGNFYEGFMATGIASEATDAAIQANIVAVQYSGWNSPAGGPDLE